MIWFLYNNKMNMGGFSTVYYLPTHYFEIGPQLIPTYSEMIPQALATINIHQINQIPLNYHQLQQEQSMNKRLDQQLNRLHNDTIHHKKTHWTREEDRLLERLVQVNKLAWREIPPFFQDRTQNMCYSRYRRISINSKDKIWIKQDENRVLALVERHGQKWNLISSCISKFNSKQIRQRYLNYIRPNINREQFTIEEDRIICKHWRRLQKLLPGRNQGAVKGRYYGKLKDIVDRLKDNSY